MTNTPWAKWLQIITSFTERVDHELWSAGHYVTLKKAAPRQTARDF